MNKKYLFLLMLQFVSFMILASCQSKTIINTPRGVKKAATSGVENFCDFAGQECRKTKVVRSEPGPDLEGNSTWCVDVELETETYIKGEFKTVNWIIGIVSVTDGYMSYNIFIDGWEDCIASGG